MAETIHQGRNIKRFREMLGLKQEALAIELGDDWNQKKISLLESKELLDDALLEQVAKVLRITPDAIKNFDEESAINYFNTFHDNTIGNAFAGSNFHCTFNPIDKIVELYEALIKSEKEKNDFLQRMLEEKK